MSHSFWLDKEEERSGLEVDVCIIGAGIAGLSTAYWLKKGMPDLKTVVVEKGSVGSGATGRNAGFITCGSVEHFNRMVSKHGESQALEIWRYSEENLRLLESEVIGSLEAQVEFKKNGAFSLATEKNEFLELQSVSDIMNRNGIPVEILDESQVGNRLGTRGFVGGIKYLQDAEVHPIKLLSLLQAQVGLPVLEHQEVYKIENEGSHRRVFTKNHEIKTTLVVVCCNGYSSSVHPYFEEKIFPTRGQIMVLEKQDIKMEGPCYANFYLDYFRQLATGELLVGGFRQLEKDTEKGFSDHTTEKIQQALHDFVKKHLPSFTNSSVNHRWAGVMGFSVDGEPMVGSLPTDNQVFFLGGFTGHGLGLAFHGAKTLVDLISGQPIPDWISAKRF